jgi:hypothetical protein
MNISRKPTIGALYKEGEASSFQHTSHLSFTLHAIISGSVPLGASHLVVIENRERGEERAKEEPGLSEPLYLVPLRSRLILSSLQV